MSINPGTLYIVATPIGNLGDITVRAAEVLRRVDTIYAEDTRHSARLLQHLGIQNSLKSLHEHNEIQRIDGITGLLESGASVAVISDAGTPLISDPGYRLVAACHSKGLTVSPVPGPSAIVAALSTSGLATDRFLFLGFPPARSAARQQWLTAAALHTCTVVVYESRHRIRESLQDMSDCFGPDRMATVARELTKTYETIRKAPLGTLCEWIENPVQQKGEFVIMLEGNSTDALTDEVELKRVVRILLAEMSVKKAAECAVELTGCKRKQAYNIALALQTDGTSDGQ